jgi:sec-independent protein translocase protein TatC
MSFRTSVMRATSVMWRTLKSVGHDQELTFVDHLDELRTRLIVSLVVVGAAFGVCFWQNGALLDVVDAPLAHQTAAQVRHGGGPLGATYTVQKSAKNVAVQVRSLVGVLEDRRQPAGDQAVLTHVGTALNRDVRALSAPATGDKPITLGLGEPFTTTITVTLIFALIVSLPFLLIQLYGFFMPAFEPDMRRKMRPVLTAVPGLFIAGVLFGYFVVLPAAIHFLQNFNSNQFNVLVQASQYYSFAATLLLAMGLIFEIPVAIIAATQSGAITPRQLRGGRRWAIAGSAAVAAFMPGDAITMLLEAVPLYILFEIGLAIATVLERRTQRRAAVAVAAAPA